MKLVSACLIGLNCRYDCKNNLKKSSSRLIKEYKEGKLIPICAEQLGGLSTPRIASEIKDNRVINKEGNDVTSEFEKGAQEVLKVAKDIGCSEAIFAARSPSCGCGKIYDGTFSGKLIDGDGITTRLLKKNGVKVISVEDYE